MWRHKRFFLIFPEIALGGGPKNSRIRVKLYLGIPYLNLSCFLIFFCFFLQNGHIQPVDLISSSCNCNWTQSTNRIGVCSLSNISVIRTEGSSFGVGSGPNFKNNLSLAAKIWNIFNHLFRIKINYNKIIMIITHVRETIFRFRLHFVRYCRQMPPRNVLIWYESYQNKIDNVSKKTRREGWVQWKIQRIPFRGFS